LISPKLKEIAQSPERISDLKSQISEKRSKVQEPKSEVNFCALIFPVFRILTSEFQTSNVKLEIPSFLHPDSISSF
jgi:hypothetical protein